MPPRVALLSLRPDDAERVIALLRATAASGTLGRDPDEYDLGDVRTGLEKAAIEDLLIGAVADDDLIGVVQGSRLAPRRFRHVIAGVSIAVHPDHQGRGIGRRLFEELLARADRLDPPADRMELILQAGNRGAQRLYERLGFEVEGRLRDRVREPGGAHIDDIFMARIRRG